MTRPFRLRYACFTRRRSASVPTNAPTNARELGSGTVTTIDPSGNHGRLPSSQSCGPSTNMTPVTRLTLSLPPDHACTHEMFETLHSGPPSFQCTNVPRYPVEWRQPFPLAFWEKNVTNAGSVNGEACTTSGTNDAIAPTAIKASILPVDIEVAILPSHSVVREVCPLLPNVQRPASRHHLTQYPVYGQCEQPRPILLLGSAEPKNNGVPHGSSMRDSISAAYPAASSTSRSSSPTPASDPHTRTPDMSPYRPRRSRAPCGSLQSPPVPHRGMSHWAHRRRTHRVSAAR